MHPKPLHQMSTGSFSKLADSWALPPVDLRIFRTKESLHFKRLPSEQTFTHRWCLSQYLKEFIQGLSGLLSCLLRSVCFWAELLKLSPASCSRWHYSFLASFLVTLLLPVHGTHLEQQSPGPGFHILSTIAVLGWVILCCAGCPVYCVIFSSIPGPYLLDANSIPSCF